jgi:aspartyl-tRNA(Asn)/glutamyl-tRNA(Gln) amidotransferase subunit C
MDVEKLAQLARLKLSNSEKEELAKQLEAIVNHFETIQKINTEGVEPLVSPVELESFWREDRVGDQLSPEEALANAPETMGNLFKVPPVI